MEWWQILLICVGAGFLWLLLSIVFYKGFFKRFYDFLLSLIAIVILFPVLLILTIVGAIVMKGNPFFTQPRPGKNEKIFKLIKFRTMTNAKDENGNLLPDDKRLVKYGKFLRSTSLDELPELINILIGQMSIVGPRPQLVRDMIFMTDEQRKRHTVRQGLTGLAQVNGRNGISWEKKLELDLEYINKISLFGDIKIIFGTVFSVLKKQGITEEGMETASDYGVYLLQSGKISQEEFDEKMLEAKNLLGE